MPSSGKGEAVLPWAVDTAYDYRTCKGKHAASVEFYNQMRTMINGD